MLAAGANLSKMTVEDSKSRRECTQAGVTPFVVFFSGAVIVDTQFLRESAGGFVQAGKTAPAAGADLSEIGTRTSKIAMEMCPESALRLPLFCRAPPRLWMCGLYASAPQASFKPEKTRRSPQAPTSAKWADGLQKSQRSWVQWRSRRTWRRARPRPRRARTRILQQRGIQRRHHRRSRRSRSANMNP
jgi:hypothetical protein